MTTPLAIETIHLRKVYGRKVAVEDLSLQVPPGEVFGFLGPNGAGKSTTVKMLLSLVRPTQGQIVLLGGSVDDPRIRAKVGFLPEHFRYHEWLKAGEFLRFHGQLYGVKNDVLKQRIPEMLDLVGLADRFDSALSSFSKGMLQRVGLAQAMLNEPDIIFLDEPTSGLDPLGRRLVRDVIYKLKAKGTTVFLNSHLLSEVEVTCDRVAFIKKGRVVQRELMSNLLDQTTEVTIKVDRITPPLLAALEQLGHNLQPNGTVLSMMVNERELVPEVAKVVLDQGCKLYELSPRRKSLEDIFMSIIEAN